MSDVPSQVTDFFTCVRNGCAEASRRLRERPVLDLVAPLTLVLLLLYPVGSEPVRIALQLGSVAGLVYSPLQRTSGYWGVLAAGMGVGCLILWHDADNHKYLITYWCLALGLSCRADDTTKAVRINARLLIGLCFLWAVAWKLRTPDFLTGEYYQFAMLTDERLFSVGQLFSGMSPDVYVQNQEAMERLTAYSTTFDRVSFEGVSVLRPVSLVLVAWTLLVESWVVISHLWPTSSKWGARSQYASLLLFIVTTYAAAHVGGYAWILTIMGLAQVRPARASWRLAYLGGLALVIVYQFGPIEYLVQFFYG
jgi:hypothetical protein